MNTIEVTVKEVFGATKKNRYPVKLVQDNGTRTVLGRTETMQRTYFIMMNEKIEVGEKHSLDLDLFDITIQEYKTKDKASGEEIVIPTKWLRRKG